MKMLAGILVLCVVATALPLSAQVSIDTMLTYDVLTKDYNTLVKDAMNLDEEQWKAFEGVLKEYRAAMDPINRQRIQLMQEFIKKNGVLNDAEAQARLNTIQENERDEWLVQRDFQKEFLKVIPAAKVLRFWQIQNRMMLMMSYSLAKDLPLAKAE